MKDQLVFRLYREPYLYETARAVGHDGLKRDELDDKLKSLIDRFGRGYIDKALFTLTDYAPESARPIIKLRDDVVRLCWQLLGPPPGTFEYNHFHSSDPWTPPWKREEPKPESKPEPPKENKLAHMTNDELACQLALARNRQAEFTARSKAGKEARKEVELILEELKLRGNDAA